VSIIAGLGSRTDYERMKPTLKDDLLRGAGAAGDDDDDVLEAVLRHVRASGAELGGRNRKPPL
jgi:hypothetical protein